jgi:hypothetical protein
MSMFGSVDTNKLSNSLENGTYLCELSEVKHFHSKDKPCPIGTDAGKHSLVFEWEVIDENSDHYGKTFQQWFAVFPELTDEVYNALSGKEKKFVRDRLNWLNIQIRNLGANADSIKDLEDFQNLAETVRYIDITINPSKDDSGREFVQVRKMSAPDDDSASDRAFNF